MAANEIHKNDVGTIFEIEVRDSIKTVNISTATDLFVIFKKPDGTTVQKTGVFKTDGSDGIIQYTTVLNDLDIAGKWKLQANIVLPNGSWYSDITNFEVVNNL